MFACLSVDSTVLIILSERKQKHVNNHSHLFPFRRHWSRVTRTSSKGCELRWSVPDFSPSAQLCPHPLGCHLVFIAPSLRNPPGMDCPEWTTGRPTLQPLPSRSTFEKKCKNTDNLSRRKERGRGLQH